MAKVEVVSVAYGEERYHETADLAKNCSFQGTGRYFASLMEENDFCDFERVYAAVYDDTVVGFSALFLCTVSHQEFYEKLGFEALYDTQIANGVSGVVMKKEW